MIKYFISDLHIADKSDKDDFKQEKRLFDFLEVIPDNSLIIVGDGLELWQKGYNEIYQKRRALLSLLYQKAEYWVLGNHDAKFWDYRRNSLLVNTPSVEICVFSGAAALAMYRPAPLSRVRPVRWRGRRKAALTRPVRWRPSESDAPS